MAKTIQFNTGRPYAADGQVIKATLHDDGIVTFMDHSRSIDGGFTMVEGLATFGPDDVMFHYDRGLYVSDSRSRADGLYRGGCNSLSTPISTETVLAAVETALDNESLPDENMTDSRFDVVTGTALSSWASYLVNGDDSGIDADEKAQADAFAAWLGGSIVDCADAGFRWHHDGLQFGGLAGDCQTYTALVQRESSR